METKGQFIPGDISKLAMNSKTAASVAEACGSRDSVIEPKFDGIRLLINIAENGVYAYSRSGKSKTGKLPAIEAELAANLPAGTWIDGEAVAFNKDGTQDWGGAQSVLGSGVAKAAAASGVIRFVVFDLLAHGGLDARSLPLRQRRLLLEMIFANEDKFRNIILSPQGEASDEAHEVNLTLGFEGSMVKHLDAPYQSNRRSANSLKLKATDTVDAVITGFLPAEPGSWIAQAGYIGKIEFTHYQDGVAIEGRCSGMTTAERADFTARQAELIGTVIEVSYMTRMPGTGKLRHPQFKRLRNDKTAEECKS
jgi:ATP-dependent DNA ligase